MPISRKLLSHTLFKKQYEAFRKQRPDAAAKKQLLTAFRVALANPGGATAISGVGGAELQGKVFKAYVGGPGGHRFVYIFYPNLNLVVPVLLTPLPKSRMRWEDEPWESIGEEIAKSLASGDFDSFEDWTDAAEKEK